MLPKTLLNGVNTHLIGGEWQLKQQFAPTFSIQCDECDVWSETVDVVVRRGAGRGTLVYTNTTSFIYQPTYRHIHDHRLTSGLDIKLL